MARKLQVHVGNDLFVKFDATVTGKISKSCRVCAHNEKEDSLVLFHGDDFLAESRDTSLDKLDECWMHSRSDACHAFVQQLVVRVLLQNDTVERIWILVSWKMRDMLQHHMYVSLEKDKPTLCD